MPIFMDLHVVPGIEAKHAAEAHREDLKVQDDFGCRCMTYWVDEERGNAFCLIDAPDEAAVRQMHDKAHGLVPGEIIQVNSNVVEAFLGRIHDPDGFTDSDDPDLKIFNDPAFRIILVTKTTNARLLQHELGIKKAKQLLSLYHEIVREQLKKYEGREVELDGEGFIASFVSVSQAIQCATAIQKGLHVAAELIQLRIGLNAGMPISQNQELFGDAVKMARYLCGIGTENQIVLASIIRELYKDDGQGVMDDRDRIKWISPGEENFLQILMDTLSDQWNNPGFGVIDFCRHTSMSKSQLYRKCTALTGMSPNELLRNFRLQKSLDLLKTDRNITQTTFDAGFSSPSYFTKCFQRKFGLQPIAYLKNQV